MLDKRLVLDSTDREHHFLSRFEKVTVHNVGLNEGNLRTVRAIDNSKPLRVNFLDDPYHFVGSPRAKLFPFSVSPGTGLSKELLCSLFFPARLRTHLIHQNALRRTGDHSPLFVRIHSAVRLGFDPTVISRA